MNFRELDEILVYEFLKNFALSLIGIFIPVYIVSQGFSLYHAGLFIVISGFLGTIGSYPIAKIISKIGFKHSLAASFLFLIPGLLIIQSLEISLAVIVVSSVLYNIGRLFHNIGLNSEFAVDSDSEKRSEDSGKMLSLPSISRVIAPLIGGIVFAAVGFQTLAMIAIGILLLSIIPLMTTEDHRDPMDYNFSQILKDEYRDNVPIFVIRGIQAVTAVQIFGLFVFYLIGGSFDVGGARALDSLGFVITGLLIGRMVADRGGDLFVKIGCTGAAAAHFLRAFLYTPIQVFTVSLLGGIFFQIYHVPLYSRFADEAEKEEVLEFYTLRKIFVSAGNILTVSAMFIFYSLYGLRAGFTASFVLAGLSSLAMIFFYMRN